MRLAELFPAGEKILTGSLLFTAEDIVRFARKFDPQPFHVDAEAAKDYVFGALCASGWHTCAGRMKIFITYWQQQLARLESEGIAPPKLGPSPGFQNLQWLKPVYAGDTVSYYVTLVESRPLASRPGAAINMILNEAVNQRGEVVMRYDGRVLDFE